MSNTETTTSVNSIPPSVNSDVFSPEANAAVNQVISIADARMMLQKANKSSTSLRAWALDFVHLLTGTEKGSAQHYAEMVSSRTRVGAANNESYKVEEEKKAA